MLLEPRLHWHIQKKRIQPKIIIDHTTNAICTCAFSTHSRWQPADEAADPRYVGDIGAVAPKYGLFGKEKEKAQKVEDLKQLWGI